MNKQRLQQKQYQNLSPQQIQFLGLLQTPIIALEKRIEEELEENPALEELEEEEEEISLSERSFQQYNNRDVKFQIEDKSESLSDYLGKQLIAIDIDENLLLLVNYLINSLDENGFLKRDLHSIASDLLISNNLNVSEQKLNNALKIVQQLEPFGVGAKNTQESLLIQLKLKYPKKKLEQEILSNYYTSFSNKNFEYLTKHLCVSLNTLKKAYSTIESLNPIPGSGFSKNTEADYIYPDFSITIIDDKLKLKLNNGNVKLVRVSSYYQKMIKETEDEATKKFLVDKVERASWFKNAIEKRNETLKNVVTAILRIQESYFTSGNEKELKPMKLADIAQIVNMDISTISRVSNSKYIATHFGTFKLKELFSEAYRKDSGELISTKEIKMKLKELIASENKITPFTDEKLAELLGENDYHIARRTVAKYRENLSIPIAKLRREL